VLLDGDEYDRFGTLRTDAEREAFIDGFWKQLDANPGPNETSFRATFEARCAIANVRFQTIDQPGWRTERGRVFVALGEPKAIRQESGGVKAIAKEVWIYGTPGAPGASLEIAFFRCADGSYRTDPSCPVVVDPTSVSFDWQRNNYFRTLRDNNPGLSLVRVRALLNDLLATLPRSVAQIAAAPPSSGGGGDVAAGVPGDQGASSRSLLRVAPYYFRAQDGSVLAFVVMDVRDEDATPRPAGGVPEGTYVAAASFEETGKGGERRPDASSRSTALEPIERAGAKPVFFGRAYLESGRTYAVRYALKDNARGELLVKHDLLTVPDLGVGFSVSSLVPAERFGPAGESAGRYQVGSEEVVPKPDASFRRSEMLRLYVQVYGAAIDPARQAPRVDVVFRFQRLIKGAAKRFRKPFSVQEAAGAAIGLEVPVGDWPPGPYRVSVDLHDRVSGERIGVGGAFTILDE
jgi:GWxTD domain-containing protein